MRLRKRDGESTPIDALDQASFWPFSDLTLPESREFHRPKICDH
jgi:hypothetical protein